MRSLMVFSPLFNLNITTENYRLNCETAKENVDQKKKKRKWVTKLDLGLLTCMNPMKR